MDRRHPRFFYLLRSFGSRRVSAALYAHGRPPRMSALAALLVEQERQEAREIYTGNVLWALLHMFGKDVQMPSLSELMHEERVKDNRTGAEIVRDVLQLLKK